MLKKFFSERIVLATAAKQMMDAIAQYKAEQDAANDVIRSSYSFMKYAERIRDRAPAYYVEARLAWINAIEDGITLMERIAQNVDDPVELNKFASQTVSITTEMKHSVYTATTSQGQCSRETWKFSWETSEQTGINQSS